VTASPMELSLRRLRRDGWTPGIVERRIPGRFTTIDFLGIADIIAVRPGETIAVQATSYSNVSAHVRKLSASPHLAALFAADWGVVVWGWRKKDGKWVLREVKLAETHHSVQHLATRRNATEEV
jgi:hypothetical protein